MNELLAAKKTYLETKSIYDQHFKNENWDELEVCEDDYINAELAFLESIGNFLKKETCLSDLTIRMMIKTRSKQMIEKGLKFN